VNFIGGGRGARLLNGEAAAPRPPVEPPLRSFRLDCCVGVDDKNQCRQLAVGQVRRASHCLFHIAVRFGLHNYQRWCHNGLQTIKNIRTTPRHIRDNFLTFRSIKSASTVNTKPNQQLASKLFIIRLEHLPSAWPRS